MKFKQIIALLAVVVCLLPSASLAGEKSVQIATFNVDATPPIGSPVAYAPTRKIEDPLFARGIVLFADGKPVVLCAVDWIGIANGGQDVWREKLAVAAGTSADRVAVHTLHQHDGPRNDFTASAVLAEQGLTGRSFDDAFARSVIEKTADAIRTAVKSPQPVTHLGVGRAKVEKVASNRRILDPHGKVKIVRYSSSKIPEAIAAPEGVIDPWLRSLTFYNEDEPLVVLTYYATHPQSYYGKGDVTSEFVGIGRAKREKATDGLLHVHFNGASGNVAAGKYNDGSERMRPILAERMADGMKRAWQSTEKRPLSRSEVEWRVHPVQLPIGEHLDAETLTTTLENEQADVRARLSAATKLTWLRRVEASQSVDLTCLKIGDVYILHMPGELFIEYQLAAQAMRPDATVCMAAYGEYGPGYIGTAVAYGQGGYETSDRATNVSSKVEDVLMAAMRKLLK